MYTHCACCNTAFANPSDDSTCFFCAVNLLLPPGCCAEFLSPSGPVLLAEDEDTVAEAEWLAEQSGIHTLGGY